MKILPSTVGDSRQTTAAARLGWPGLLFALFGSLAFCMTLSLRASVYVFGPYVGAGAALDHTDGTGGNARFFNPTSVAVDTAGNVYIADGGDNAIRKISPGGATTTLAGSAGQSGLVDGTGAGALFIYPYGIAVDGSGNVYVADAGANTIRKVTPGGASGTLAGTAGIAGSVDGTGTSAQFNSPEGIAVDSSGNVWVADTNNSTVRKIAPNGATSTIGVAGQTGTSDGTGSAARFSYPVGLAADASGNVYVADFGNNTIRRITGTTVVTIAGNPSTAGAADGTGESASFNHPAGVAVDGQGNLYVADTSNQTIRKVVLATATVTTIAGFAGEGGNADGAGTAARFFYPYGIGSNAAGNVYVADTGNHSVRSVSGSSVVTYAGAEGTSGAADGAGTAALFDHPRGCAVDASGNLFIADQNNNTIRRIATNGVSATLAGTAGIIGSADGAGAAASFSGPADVAVDANDNVYVADSGNSTIRKIAPNGTVTTLAGLAGTAGSSDGAGSSARFNAPQGIAVDSAGNVWVADTNNCTVREITPAGAVTTIAGTAGQYGSVNAVGTSARFDSPNALAVDAAGNVYVADTNNDTVRKIAPGGSVTTLAGLAGQGGFADGTGNLAHFNQPTAIAVDGSGNAYVADTNNRAVRMVSPAGTVTTLDGTWSRYFYPQGITVGASGTIYVVDGDNEDVVLGQLLQPPASGATIASESVQAAQSATFSAGTPISSDAYQWQVSTNGGTTWTDTTDGSTYSGSATASLAISSAAASMNGYLYRVVVSNAAGSGVSSNATLTVTDPPPPSESGAARLINVSALTFAGTGSNTLTVGFAIGGTGSKEMLIRGDGPTLAQYGVTGTLSNPVLTLFTGTGTQIAANAGWGGSASLSAVFTAVGAFPLPAGSADSAIYQSLTTGSYTAEVTGANGTTGMALAEIYDADGTATPSAEIINLSTRAFVGTGSGVLTAGFVVGGTGSITLLIRGDGPALANYGVTGVLAAPQLTVYNSAGTAIATNTAWGGTASLAAIFTEVGAFSLSPTSNDTAVVLTLQPGAYTAVLSGVNGTTGVGLIEVYEVP